MCAKQHFVARITAVERSEQHIYQFVLFVYRACLIHPDILRDYEEGREKKKREKKNGRKSHLKITKNIFRLCQIFQALSKKSLCHLRGKEQG